VGRELGARQENNQWLAEIQRGRNASGRAARHTVCLSDAAVLPAVFTLGYVMGRNQLDAPPGARIDPTRKRIIVAAKAELPRAEQESVSTPGNSFRTRCPTPQVLEWTLSRGDKTFLNNHLKPRPRYLLHANRRRLPRAKSASSVRRRRPTDSSSQRSRGPTAAKCRVAHGA